MIGIGARLKEARISKGLTLEDLQDSTKIQQRYLSAIENEEFQVIPGAFYVRVFIKQYAEAVDLDADEILSLYQDEYEPAVQEKQESVVPATMQRSAGSKQNNQLRDAMPKIIVALFILMIFVIVYTLLRDKATEPAIDQESSEPGSSVVTDEQGSVGVDKPKQPFEHASTVGETSTFKLTDTNKITLIVKATGKSWISVTDQDGVERMPEPSGARVVQEGETIEIEANDAESLRIRVGNYENAELTVNGQRVDYPTELIPQNIVLKKP
ncbi:MULTISPECIES: RodZ domain-containing protein [unclassified Sporosarcina]|uniref:helix-turn-helix domain-containing protein n=1 Tax=unclassified Sporosarcina TaxID=2647733 RepID=UPI0013046E22|nr:MULTISPECIES: RodZ domain-containing protein [unclassified Sporosarcina]